MIDIRPERGMNGVGSVKINVTEETNGCHGLDLASACGGRVCGNSTVDFKGGLVAAAGLVVEGARGEASQEGVQMGKVAAT
jgi:hypothetical protein